MARIQTKANSCIAMRFALVLALLLPLLSFLSPSPALAFQESIPLPLQWPAGLPVYDHVVIVIEENKGYEQIVGNKNATYINDVLRKEGATLTNFYAEEHHSEGNYFWLFSGSNQHVGYIDRVPGGDFATSNLGAELVRTGRSFKGYCEGLPEIGSPVAEHNLYARKHVPWASFSNLPRGKTLTDASNLRFPQDFPSDYNLLPTVSFVIPDLVHDMHNGKTEPSIMAGDAWLRERLDGYYKWAKQHNSLLIVTWDESGQSPMMGGMTDPADNDPIKRNRIATVLAGAHIKHGEYGEGKGVTHVNLLRTLEAMYKLNRSGNQPFGALKAGIADDFVINDVFE
jgi:phosphatidylinositol-3-phosphatase